MPEEDLHPTDPPRGAGRQRCLSQVKRGMRSGTRAAPSEGKAPLAAIGPVKHKQGYTSGTDKCESQLYFSC